MASTKLLIYAHISIIDRLLSRSGEDIAERHKGCIYGFMLGSNLCGCRRQPNDQLSKLIQEINGRRKVVSKEGINNRDQGSSTADGWTG